MQSGPELLAPLMKICKKDCRKPTLLLRYCNFPTCGKYFSLLMIEWNQPKLELFQMFFLVTIIGTPVFSTWCSLPWQG